MDDLNQSERYDCGHLHEDILSRVNEAMPDDEILYDLAELFKIFGDSTRIKILYVLLESEMCVCDIAQLLGMTQSAISHQLRSLKQNSCLSGMASPWGLRNNLSALFTNPCRLFSIHQFNALVLFFYKKS